MLEEEIAGWAKIFSFNKRTEERRILRRSYGKRSLRE